MPQSLVKNYLHIVFSTKKRAPFISAQIESELHKYLWAICDNLECTPIKIGGYDDHIHILCALSKKISLIKLVEEIKSHSSKWMKTKGEHLRNFYWQNGYAAFSVSPLRIETVKNYIENQREHHKKITFQGEVKSLLDKYKVFYDEKYLWD
jgi:putative transposase